MTLNRNVSKLALFFVIFLFSGCTELELGSHVGKNMIGSEVKSIGTYKVGKPYVIQGKTYVPEVNYDYMETGIASWYGPGFHGGRTANGEKFYQNELTAAHKTLPLPSIVRVTNLSNGKSLIVRVNDRGPFSKGRVIDVSQKAAELLGFKNQGTAKVRVEVLEQESRKIANAAMNGQDTRGTEVAMNNPNYHSASLKHHKNTQAAQVNKTLNQPVLKTAYNQTIPGHTKNGLFYPDTVVTEEPVKPSQIYVQVGAFSSHDNALAQANKLKAFGNVKVSEVTVNNQKLYRVRLPAKDVPTSQSLIKKVINAGYKESRVIVD